MNDNLTEQTRVILRLAEEEARSFRHEYIGTEHLLLGLMREEWAVAATVLRSHGIDLAKIRQEIEQLVQYGTTEVTQKELPLTPRAQQALDFAEEEARMVGQATASTEHMLLGLLREPDGVAGIVLHKLGFQPELLRQEVFKIRLLQMKIVERVVRPLRAHIHRKRKVRDELLAHLSAIYDEEIARVNDPFTAVEAAAKRFGEPKELTAELQETVPVLEKWEFVCGSCFDWRPPETVTRWMARLGAHVGLMMLTMCVLAAFFVLKEFGWTFNALLALRPIVALGIVLPISVAVSCISYFKIRDHIYGVFGSRKSWGQAIAWAGILAMVIVGCGFTFLAISYGNFSPAMVAFYPSILVGIIWAAGALVVAKILGPQEIRDATWALLDLSC